MAIILEVQPYCATCPDFEADVTRPNKVQVYVDEFILSDTIVKCRYAKRCENIRKFLAKQDKEEK